MNSYAPTQKVASPFARKPLPQFRVASPCAVGWDSMSGDEKRRLCALCDKHVVNLTTMTQPEIDRVVESVSAGGEACVRAWQREDGTLILESDCPVGLARLARDAREATHRTFRWAWAGAGLVAAAVGMGATWQRAEAEMSDAKSPSGSLMRSLLGRPCPSLQQGNKQQDAVDVLRIPERDLTPAQREERSRRMGITGFMKDTRAS